MGKIKPLNIIYWLVILLFVLFVYGYIVVSLLGGLDNCGVFGDMFGGIAALFSGLAFGGMIWAIILQTKELELQRKELEASRVAQARTAEAQEDLVEKQHVTARIQGMAAIVQGRYQYAAAYGGQAEYFVEPAEAAEKILLNFMKKAHGDDINLPDNKRK
jgi:hypothetical protein